MPVPINDCLELTSLLRDATAKVYWFARCRALTEKKEPGISAVIEIIRKYIKE